MGAYTYCRKCDRALPGPWDVGTDVLLEVLTYEDFAYICPDCGEPNHVLGRFKDNVIAELADRIDRKGETKC
jgi:hypothetical protein